MGEMDAEPVLTYYEPLETFGKGRRVQLLIPKILPNYIFIMTASKFLEEFSPINMS
jgi:hypothetical protein